MATDRKATRRPGRSGTLKNVSSSTFGSMSKKPNWTPFSAPQASEISASVTATPSATSDHPQPREALQPVGQRLTIEAQHVAGDEQHLPGGQREVLAVADVPRHRGFLGVDLVGQPQQPGGISTQYHSPIDSSSSTSGATSSSSVYIARMSVP